jgi:DNA-binding transcriptional regulator YiaG
MNQSKSGGFTTTPKTQPAPCTAQEHAHFAGSLRKWRTGRGLVLKEVADAFGVAEATWSRWEKRERFPSPANLRRLAEFIGVPICCFFYPEPGSCPNCPGKAPPHPPSPTGVVSRVLPVPLARFHEAPGGKWRRKSMAE